MDSAGPSIAHPGHLEQGHHAALAQAMKLRSLKQVVMMQMITMLNWVMEAKVVGARCSLPGFFLQDYMKPRQ